jgi:hypothetical protein
VRHLINPSARIAAEVIRRNLVSGNRDLAVPFSGETRCPSPSTRTPYESKTRDGTSTLLLMEHAFATQGYQPIDIEEAIEHVFRRGSAITKVSRRNDQGVRKGEQQPWQRLLIR